MADTLAMIEATLAHLEQALPDLAVELFPQRPAEYRLNHPVGAVLLGYPGSVHKAPRALGMVAQERKVRFGCTLVARQVWGSLGAVALLDSLRQALVGWAPPDCEAITALDDKFLTEEAGVWWYASDFEAQSLTLEDREPDSGPRLIHTTLLDDYTTRTEIILHPEGEITTEHFEP